MRRLAVLACMTLLAACTGEIGSGETPELEDTAYAVPANGIVYFPPVLSAFKASPLATETFDPATGPAELTSLPFDPETRKFIKYTVECALDEKQEVKFYSDVYTGLLGECPSWNEKKPNTDCLEAVSGCLLARQNPLELRVRFSPRGQRAENPSFDAYQVASADTYEPDFLGTKISSFWTSCNGTPGELRDCGWNAETALTGTCTPGALVSLGAGAKVGDCNNALGSAISGDMAMRACEGMSGCNAASVTHLGSNNDTCDRNPALDFVCPASGVFSAMLSSMKAGDAFDGSIGASSSSPVEFPSKIIDLFSVLEASYYGNMFHAINPNVTLVPLGHNEGYILKLARGSKEHTGFGSPQVFPFEDAWCCYDPDFDSSYLDDGRVCAFQPVLDPKGKPAEANLCMCKSLGPCNTVKKDSRTNRCMVYDQAPDFGDVDHDTCRDGASVGRKWPMTVFLHEACDMVGQGDDGGNQLCKHK